jgi:hypothetical protein
MNEDMTKWIIIAAIVAVISVVTTRKKAPGQGWRKTATNALVAGIACFVGAFAASFGFEYLTSRNPDAQIDRAITELRDAPYVGMLLRNTPGAEDNLRQAMRQDLSAGASGPKAPNTAKVLAGLREEHARPALLAAGDELILKVADDQGQMIRWLADNNEERCARTFVQGIGDPTDIGAAFTPLFKEYLTSTEAAYTDGRGGTPKRFLSIEEAGAIMVRDLGIVEADFATLNNLEAAAPKVLCDLSVRMSTDLGRVQAADRADYARWITTFN